MAQGVHVVLFLKKLRHLVHGAMKFTEQAIMLVVLGLINVVMGAGHPRCRDAARGAEFHQLAAGSASWRHKFGELYRFASPLARARRLYAIVIRAA